MHPCWDWRLYVIVSVKLTNCLADEAVFMVTRLVIPLVTTFSPKIEAWLNPTSPTKVWLVRVPVCVDHILVSELGIGLFDVRCHFPHKLGPGPGIYTLSCRPNIDSIEVTKPVARRPLVVWKQLASTLLPRFYPCTYAQILDIPPQGTFGQIYSSIKIQRLQWSKALQSPKRRPNVG